MQLTELGSFHCIMEAILLYLNINCTLLFGQVEELALLSEIRATQSEDVEVDKAQKKRVGEGIVS